MKPLPEIDDLSLFVRLRFNIIQWLAGHASIVINAEFDERGCVLTTPSLFCRNIVRPGTKILVFSGEGTWLTLGGEKGEEPWRISTSR